MWRTWSSNHVNVNPRLINHGLLIRGYSPNSHFIWYLNGIPPNSTTVWGLLIQGWHYTSSHNSHPRSIPKKFHHGIPTTIHGAQKESSGVSFSELGYVTFLGFQISLGGVFIVTTSHLKRGMSKRLFGDGSWIPHLDRFRLLVIKLDTWNQRINWL